MKQLMKKSPTAVLLAALLAGMAGGAQAADQGHGKITFNGAVIESPCSIAPESEDQTVELGQISMDALKVPIVGQGGSSTPVSFEIKLENCDFFQGDKEPRAGGETLVSVTFVGAEGKNGMLGISGSAKGAGIVITDGAGTPIKLGEPSAPHGLKEGDNTLLFSAYLKGNGVLDPVVPGEFTAVADFMLDYS